VEDWNFLAMGVEPAQHYRARDLLLTCRNEQLSVDSIMYWNVDEWKSYQLSLPIGSFELSAGQPFFLLSKTRGVLPLAGNPLTASLPLDLHTGWNAVCFPAASRAYKASELLNALNVEGCSSSVIARWESGGWVQYFPLDPASDFTISENKGYLLLVTQPCTFTP
jgi:hypothetical protein